MSNKKISDLTDGSPLQSTDELVIARAGSNNKIPASSVLGISAGLTGATDTTRWAGATASGNPTSGTFLTGDWIVDKGNKSVWLCTSGGTPGTWAEIGNSPWKDIFNAKKDFGADPTNTTGGQGALLSNALQALAAGQAIVLDHGTYKCDDQGVDFYDGTNWGKAIALLGASPVAGWGYGDPGWGGSILSFPNDFGASHYGVYVVGQGSVLANVTVQGNNGTKTLGTQNMAMWGVLIEGEAIVDRVMAAAGFRAGFVWNANHAVLMNSTAANCYYGLLYAASRPTAGDNLALRVVLTGMAMASI